MWVNTAEIPGNGIDDDGNGYIDDIHGANTIANNGSADMKNTGNPMDDHGHGTHVAGIAAACNNKEGIVGIAYNAKIMAVKAGQASGVFNQSDIAEAILYAYAMGADVINMSFGGAACSIAIQDALTTAYTTASLIASAGNDGMHNEGLYSLPNYPAALSYVVGVMSVGANGMESVFTNYDVQAFNAIEYEVYAPGEQLMSTLPDGRYGRLSGTSMAAPVVSGAAALLRSYFSDRDMYPSKFIMAQLCATSDKNATCCDPQRHGLHNLPPVLDVHKALTKMPTPDVSLYDYYLFDTKTIAEGNSGDGVVDAGETIEIGAILRNRWGMSKNTVITISDDSSLGVDNPYVEILTESVNFDGVGTYSTKDKLVRDEGKIVVGTELPLVIKIADNCPNDYLVTLSVLVTCNNALDEKDKTTYTNDKNEDGIGDDTISFWVRNGVILPSQITQDMTLTKENYYIIPNATYIAPDVTVTVEAGTKIQFYTDDPQDPYADTYIPYLNVAGNFITNGTAEEPVQIFPSDMMGQYVVDIRREAGGYVELNYTTVSNPDISINFADHCTFNQIYDLARCYRYLSGGKVQTSRTGGGISATKITNSVFYKLGGHSVNEYSYSDTCLGLSGIMENCVFSNCDIRFSSGYAYHNCVFMGNNLTDEYGKIWNSTDQQFTLYTSSVSAVVRNAETGTTYIVISVGDLSSNNTLGQIRNFCKMLGGDICCIETEEEWEFLKENLSYQYGYVGLTQGSKYWVNGAPVGDFIQIKNETFTSALARLNKDKLLFSNVGYSSPILMEVPGSIYCDSITLQETAVAIDDQTQYQIVPTVLPTTFDKQTLVYVSDDESVATVDEKGLVTPKRQGEVKITVYAPDYLAWAECTISVVEKVALQHIQVMANQTTFTVGEGVQVWVEYAPYNTTERMVTYSVEGEGFAVDAFGYVTATTSGVATVTAMANGKYATIELTAVRPVEQVVFAQKVFQTYVGDTANNWQPSVLPADATDRTLVWQSSNPDVAYVDEAGRLVRVSAGLATLRTTAVGGVYAECDVYVSAQPISSVTVRKVQAYERFSVAVLQDNTLWCWGKHSITPKKIAEGIQDFVLYAGGYSESFPVFILTTEGEVKKLTYNYSSQPYIDSTWVDGELKERIYLKDVVKLEGFGGYSSGNVYAFKKDGSVWAWGENNSYGQLGDGSKITQGMPVQTILDNVVDVAATNYASVFLTADGKAYAFGGYTGYTSPYLLKENVASVLANGSIIVTCRDGKQYSYDGNLYEYLLPNDATYFYWNGNGSSNNCYLKDGVAYTKFSWGEQGNLCAKVENVQDIILEYQGYYIYLLTADGGLYGVGLTTYGSFGAYTPNAVEYEPQPIFFIDEDKELALQEDNLADGRLMEEKIVLDFNVAIHSGDKFGNIVLKDGEGETLAIKRQIAFDCLTIAPYGEWENGATYTLTIPAGAFFNAFGSSLAELTYTFTYYNTTEICLIEQSVADGTVSYGQAFVATFKYTFAKEGEHFADIRIEQAGEKMPTRVSLVDSVLTVQGDLPYGEYTLYIPQGALCDMVGGVNEERMVSFSIVEQLELVSSSIVNGQVRVDEREDVVLVFTNAMEGERFAEITLSNEQGKVDCSIVIENNVLTISGGLEQGKAYVLFIPKGALCDVVGTENQEITLSFTTYAPVEEKYSSIVNGEKQVELAPVFRFAYNGTFAVNEERIVLTKAGEQVAFTAEMAGDILYVRPQVLEENTQYRLQLLSGALCDERGVESAEKIYNFTTINQVERDLWTVERGEQALAEWVARGLNSKYIGCVILNNLNDTDVEHWLRITAPSRQTGSQYLNSIGLSGNYWGTTNQAMIEKFILDFDDYQSLADINVSEILTVAPENTFPFVTDAYLLNTNGERVEVVGNERVTFVVEFNRDMDTSVPLRVRFGSFYPYADYEVTGEYVSARRWEGTYTLKTTIENGNQYFRIENGQAADDSWFKLYEAAGRFMFEIDTTSAQAMIMQGEATETGVQLTWMQDDFDTLLGYNVYRSDKEDGLYVRLNDYVLAADEKEFFDDTVEPGKVYYYNFTVVKTDLSESTPSGKIVIRAMDTMAPNIYHSPVRTAYTGVNLLVSATITDNLQITNARLYYRAVGATEWKSTAMNALNSKYTGVITAEYLDIAGMEYYIEAFDGISYTYKGDAQNPYFITVKLSVDANSLGDVDGDGVITVKDAQMLLMAKNDLLNLTEEQFLRADINGDGELSAVEAMRILDYVSGKITTIVS